MTRISYQRVASVAPPSQTRHLSAPKPRQGFVTGTTLLLAWGVLAFGAVYDWGIIVLGAGTLALAAWQWRAPGRPGLVAAGAALVVAAVGLQLLPLPRAVLESISPAAGEFLGAFDIAYAAGASRTHALSVEPALTARAFGFLLLVLLWSATVASALGRGVSVRRLTRNVAVLASIVAVLGLAQKATFNGKLLWVWTPEYSILNVFGPFVNRNHFAGWMLLAVGLTLGLLAGYLTRLAPDARTPLRDRLLWLGRAEGAPILLTGAALVLMSCALVWTMSRSGIIGAACVIAVFALVAMLQTRGMSRLVIAAGVVCLAAGVVGWRGTEHLSGWYGNTSTLQWRLQLWADTLPVLRDFSLVGSGLNTYGRVMLVRPRTDLRFDPVQAHNDYLQLAVEGGLLVAIPALLLIAAVGYRVWQAFRTPQEPMTWWLRLGAVAGIAGIAVQEISEFSLQIPGVAILFATCVGIAVHHPARRSHRIRPETLASTPGSRLDA